MSLRGRMDAWVRKLARMSPTPVSAKTLRCLDSMRAVVAVLPDAVRDAPGIRALDERQVAEGRAATRQLADGLSNPECALRRHGGALASVACEATAAPGISANRERRHT